MPPRLSWSKLLPGLLTLAGVGLVVTGVVLYAGVGKIRGEKTRFYIVTDQARGLMRGSEVWLAGQEVGKVDDIAFSAPSADTGARVVIAVSVRTKDAEQLRRDSHAQVRPGLNFIGPIVLYVVAGTPASPALRDGDTLRARLQGDPEIGAAKLNAASAEMRPVLSDARTITGKVRSGDGTIGAFLAGGGGELDRLRAQWASLRRRGTNGNGHNGHEAERVIGRTRVVFARADSIRALLGSSNSSFGRFRRDSSLGVAVANVRDEIAELRADIARAEGTLGRVGRDSALTQAMTSVQREMTLLVNDIRRRPLHYLHF